MDMFGLVLVGIGALAVAVSSIWLVVCAFQKSVVWGLLYIFVPFASIVYLFMDWNRAWKPFVISIAGIVVGAAGMAVSPSIQKGIQSSASTVQSASPAKKF